MRLANLFFLVVCMHVLVCLPDDSITCTGTSCTKTNPANNQEWVSTNLAPNFGEKIAETHNFSLQKMTLHDLKHTFQRCYDTTQSFINCAENPTVITRYKNMGYKEGSRVFAASLYIFDLLHKYCQATVSNKFAVYHKPSHVFMGYVQFESVDSQGGSEVKIYLLPAFRNKGYGKRVLKLALDYMKQHLGKPSKDLSDSKNIGQSLNRLALTVPGARDYFSATGSNAFIPRITQEIQDLCQVRNLKDIFSSIILKKFTATINNKNKSSIALFESLGFCPVSITALDAHYQFPCPGVNQK